MYDLREGAGMTPMQKHAILTLCSIIQRAATEDDMDALWSSLDDLNGVVSEIGVKPSEKGKGEQR